MRCSSFLVGILGGAIPLLAQGVPSPRFQDTLVVTASLEEEERIRLPAAVEVVDRDEIEARQVTAVADLLDTLPAMTVVRSGSPGQVTSLFTRGTESDHTLVLWNGIELNDPYFGGFNWAFLPVDGVDRVEAVRGPFSSLYGGDALGGVVQILSGQLHGARFNLEAGDHGYAYGGLSAGASLGSVRLDVAGHVRRGNGELANDFFDGEQLMARADWRPRPGLSLGLITRVADTETGIPFSAGQPSPRRRIAWQERVVGLPVHYETGSWKLSAQLSGVDYESAFRDPEDGFGFTAADTRSRAVRGRAVARYRVSADTWLAVGGEAEEATVDDRSVFGLNLEDERHSTWALFTELHWALGRVIVDLGLRHDDSRTFGGETSPRLGLQLQLGSGSRLWASYGRGFRAPSVGELYFPVTGNERLRPESSESVELGIEHRWGGWQLGLTGFENDLSDLIDFDFSSFRNVNVGRARTRGLEAKLGYQRAAWSWRWNATYLDTEDLDSGLPLLRRPRASSSLVLRHANPRWSMSATARYVGERDDVDPLSFERTINAGYARLDLAGRWQASRHLAPYLRIENLTDESYEQALGFPAPGITLVGGLSLGHP